MIKRIQYIWMVILLVSCALGMQAQNMPEQVCVGTVRHYWVEGLPGSTYTWRVNGVIQSSTADNIDIQWNEMGVFTLDVQEHQLTCDGDVETVLITVTDQIIPEFSVINEYCAGSAIPALPTTSINNITGTWSPAINNILTTEYTFTPDADQCAVPTSLTITITDGITPIFEAVAAICSGTPGIVLPTTSQNNITGTWSPAFNNTATTEYTFTPDAGQCATSTTLTVAVNEEIIPTFDPVAPVCRGSVIAALPTTSTNGITGSWSPAINNTQTTEYTFTPDANQCAIPTSLTITITDEVTPNFAQVGAYCAGSAIPALPLTSTNGIAGTWSPAIDNTRTTTYTFTPAAGQCGTTATMTITITDEIIPTFAQAGPFCAGAAIPALPTTSNNGITGTWSPAINNTQTTEYTFTPDANQCAVPTTLTITITDQITPTFAQIGPFCAGTAIPALPTTSTNGITGTWSPAINNAQTTEYTFTPDANQCAVPTTLTITITDQITPTFAQIGPFCAGFAIPALPTTSTNGITGTWSPAINNNQTTEYTFIPNAGQCAVPTTLTITISDEITPTFAQVGPYCAGFAIPTLPTTSTNGITGTWSPAIDNTQTTEYTFTPNAGQCAVSTTLTITISDEIIPTFAQVGPFCAGTAIPALPTTSNNGITGTWSPAIDNTRTATYTFTPDAGQCGATAIMTITISDEITPTFAQVGPYCAGFAIPTLPTTSTNGITGTWSPAIDNTQTTEYTFTPNAGQCAVSTTLTITISDEIIPTFAQVGPFCAGAAIPALPTTSNNGITGTWSPAIDNTRTATYTFTPDAGQCGTTATMTITISDEITPTFAQVGPYCAGFAIPTLPTTSTNGITGTWSPAIDNTQTTEYTFTPNANQCAVPTTLTITISDEITPTFAQVGPYCAGAAIPALPTTSTNGITGTWSPTINNQQTNEYTFTPNAGQCAVPTTLTITISDEITPTFAQVGPYCAGAAIPALPTTSTNGITGTWSPAINNTQTTEYTFTPNAGQCGATATMTIAVNQSITPAFDPVGPYQAGSVIASLPTVSNNGISGSWSPAINNTQTTTYTFTPDANQCAVSTTLTIVINQEVITPIFDPIGPLCRGTAIILPSTSNNGITGTWSPAINNTQTTTYTFTPDAGQGAAIVQMTIEITDEITPIFTQVGPYCAGFAIPALPTTSDNGITGTWSPAINNTQTTEYTFTPDQGQCAVPVTLTIIISDGITPTFTQVGPFCPGEAIAELPATSLNGISGVWSPAINNTQTTEYTFTPNQGQCGSITTMVIEISDKIIPTFDPVSPICMGGAITLPGISNEGIPGTWSPDIDNTQTTVYTFTPTGVRCAIPASLTVEVTESIIPAFDAVGPYCPGSNIPALPTVSNNNIPGTWSPAIDNTQTTVYTFTPEDGHCGEIVQLTIAVEESVTPSFDALGPFCVNSNIPALPTTSRNNITGSWSPAIDNTRTTTYTFTPDDGQCGTTTTLTIEIDPQVIPTFDPVGAYCQGESIAALPTVSNNGIRGSWSPAIDNNRTTTYTFTPDAGQCALTASMSIVINPGIIPVFDPVSAYCPGSAIPALPTVSNNGIRGSWSPAIDNTRTTTYTFTPDGNTCASTASITIVIDQNVTPTFDPIGPFCPGYAMEALPTVSREGVTGTWSPAINNMETTTYTFTPNEGQCGTTTTLTIGIEESIHPTFDALGPFCSGSHFSLPTVSREGIAGTWSPDINNTETTTYTFTPQAGDCSTTASLTIEIENEVTPEFNVVQSYCAGDNIPALPAVSTNGISGSWSPAINNTATTTYHFTPDNGCASPTTLTIVIERNILPTFEVETRYCQGEDIPALPAISDNGITGSWSPAIDNRRTTTYVFTPDAGQCATTASLTIFIEQGIMPLFNPFGPYCAGQAIAALPTTSNNGITGSWFPEINNTQTATYTFTPDAGQCASTVTTTIRIRDLITPTFNPVAPICEGATVTLPTISTNGIRGSWSPAIDNTRTVTYTFTPNDNQCATTATMTVTVYPIMEPIFDQVGPYCAGDVIRNLPPISTNGILGTWRPAINNTRTTTYTFTPDADQCAIITTMTITIDQKITPSFNPVGPYCAGQTIEALPTISNDGITGSWSPEINNMQTTTYTFTPDSGQCAQVATLTINIHNEITPAFTRVGPYCAGFAIPALPTVSNNGIRGTWSPEIDNTRTTTYTFTPDSGQCGTTASLTIEISDQVSPVFDPVGPFCLGTAIPALPTVSNNGIRGTWSPAINNQQTTIYTFTPNAGQCGTTASLTIEISDQITPLFDPIGPFCHGAAIGALPTVSNNGISGTWSPAINNQQTTTYTFTPNVGQCGTTTSLTIEISDEILPAFAGVGPYCAGATIAALPTVSNNGIRGSWSPAINNQQTTTYTFTPDAGQCGSSTSLTITISDQVTPTFDQPASYCEGSAIAALPTVSNNGIRGSWSPAINNQLTTTYTFTPDAGQCGTTASLTIEITDEITPTFNPVGSYTQGAAVPALPTVSNNGINGTWSPAINNQQTTTYTFTPDNGQCAEMTTLTIEITNPGAPTFDPVGPYCEGSSIPALPTVSNNGISGTWSPAINNQQTTTYTFTPNPEQGASTATLTIIINEEVIPDFAAVGPYCANAVIADLPTISTNGISGTWSPAINNQQTTTYTFTPNGGQCATNATLTIVISDEVTPGFAAVGPYCANAVIADLPTTSTNGITGSWNPAINNQRTTTYTFTPDAGQCAGVATMTIIINPAITPVFDSAGPFCRGAAIAALPTVSTNGISGTWSPAINNEQTTTYTFTPNAGQCADPVSMSIEVVDEILPIFNPVGPYCPGSVIAELPTVSTNGIRGRWRPAINNRQTTTYTFTPDAGQCGIETTLTIAIEENALPTFDPVGPYCSGSVIAELPTVSNNGIQGTWRPAINNSRTTTYTFTPDAGQCGASTTMTITITDPVTPTFDPVGPYCPGSVIAELPVVSNNGIRGSWSPAINNQQSTNYTFTPDAGQCATSTTLRIVIDQRTVPTFDPVAAYCRGASIPALRTVSNNGIRGTWRPAINNTQTTVYTFTPDAGQCSEATTLTIAVTDEVEPTFDPVGPYPRGSAIAALHTVSNNGIRGTWRPAINNQQTTTYTFTPDPGQCSRPAWMTITITDEIIPVFDPMGPYCQGSMIAELPTVSNNGIRGTWSPAINNQQTTTYTFTPDPGQSAASITRTITISNETIPVFDQMGPYCMGSVIANLPTVSNNGFRGTWSPAINNQQTATYTFTPDAGQCGTTTTMEIEIVNEILPTFNPVRPCCPGSDIAPLPVVSNNGIRGSWSPAINNQQTTTYTFTPDAGQCGLPTTLTIEIGIDIVPEFDLIGPFCPGTDIEELPRVSKNGVAGVWSPVINNMVTTDYIFTPHEGQCALTTSLTCEIGSEITPEFTQVGPYCSGSTIEALPTVSLNGVSGTWSPAIDNRHTATYTFTPDPGKCALSTVMTITILEKTTPDFAPVPSYCEGAVIAALPGTSRNGISGTWSPAIDNRHTTTYTFTPNSAACATTASLTIVINEKITPEFDQVGPYCKGSVIAPLPAVSRNGIRGRWSPAINNTVTTTYTFTPENGQCANTAQMTIEINEPVVPVFAQPDQYCIGSVIAALPLTSLNNINGTWRPAINNTRTTTYTFTPSAGQCATTAELTIQINTEAPAAVTRVIQPNCNMPTGTIEIVSPRGAQYRYRLDGASYQDQVVFSGLSPQSSHTIQVTDLLSGCESKVTRVTINSMPQSPAVPLAVVAVNPRCDGGGVIEVTRPTGPDYEYRMDGGAYQSSATFDNVTWGEHLITVRNINTGCESNAVRIFIPEVEEDMDFDGIADARDVDVDGDGILNSIEGTLTTDFDDDEFMNYRDIDADGDGIVDNLEAQSVEDYILPSYTDKDGDGLDDAYDNDQGGIELVPIDTDRDGDPDYLDLDADNDFVFDFIEGHDENSNGKPDHYSLDKDSDQDGLDDGYDMIVNQCGATENALGSNAPTQDFDGDGKPDWRDDNDDDDEYLTRFEDLNADNDYSNDDIDYDGFPEYLDYGRDCDLFIPDAFSPNGDNVHDLYMIYCINHYPNATIYIFDQLGNKIYEKKHYGNLDIWKTPAAAWWDGRPTRGPGYSRNNLVPPGTYYYVLDLGNGQVKKSYVFVSY